MDMDKLMIGLKRIWYRLERIKVGLSFFVMWNLTDAVLTYRACRYYDAVEINPFFKIFTLNLIALLAIKLLLVLVVLAIIAYILMKRPEATEQMNNLLFFVSGIYAFICFHSTHQLMVAGDPFVTWLVVCISLALLSIWFLLGGESD